MILLYLHVEPFLFSYVDGLFARMQKIENAYTNISERIKHLEDFQASMMQRLCELELTVLGPSLYLQPHQCPSFQQAPVPSFQQAPIPTFQQPKIQPPALPSTQPKPSQPSQPPK